MSSSQPRKPLKRSKVETFKEMVREASSEEEMEEIFNRRVFEEGFWNINHPNDNSVKVRKLKDDSILPEYLIKNKHKFEKLFC